MEDSRATADVHERGSRQQHLAADRRMESEVVMGAELQGSAQDLA
jgi:hypothetical protein